ncbi:MED11 [Cordylochernes scorpioides]|uniref:Mediator of RNA polymerase II transcription subunit 11 n=1 Tax=Cordylochernes scorpioides TaxID=51811 RepID=A0ABY6JZB6_9ARAC|nr:MED11 [Cordylochernes scorpioides]
MNSQMEKLKQLDAAEKEVANALFSADGYIKNPSGLSVCGAGHAFMELSKDKPSIKQMDLHTSNFVKQLQAIDTNLHKQISYLSQVSTGQAHEGSSYASQKIHHMAWHRMEHARLRLNELERLKNQHQNRQ